ncbi:MAG: STAS domain-containing protein [Bryobacterales bacterium]|nr:STAS domain-containing protein [Bryobacterales bacterium]MBV9401880.1 STAS domain-containing protein [Bryobacterales bacterium]
MLVEIEQQGDICVARFSGRLSAGAELEYLGAKGDEIKSLPSTKLLADFSHVHSVGSTGIGFVVGLFTWATKKPEGRFVLVGVRPRVKEVLDLTRLSTILPMAVDVPAGLAYLNARDAAATR